MGKRVIELLISLKDELLDIIYPPKDNCIICGEEFLGICPLCTEKIKRVKETDGILAYGYYSGVLKQLILEFKYKKNFVAGMILVEFLFDLIKDSNVSIDGIVFIPSSKKTLKQRGFNQCEYLANELSKKIKVDLYKDIIKVKNTKEQKLLSKEDRFKNISGAFDLKDKNNIKNKRLLLIDDVVTTGATVYECEKILKKNGAESIKILTVAKSYI